MLPNKPYKGNQFPNQPFNSPEVPATFDRLFGARVANDQLEPNPSEIGSFAKWVRPTDWLPLSAPGEMEEKFKGLFAVYEIDTNFLAFTFEGDYVVDWGDGSIEYFNSGEKAQHSYQWGEIPFGTLTSEGYRQVIVTVTPQRGSHLTSMDLGTYHDSIGLNGANYPIVPWLDIALSMPEADSGSSIWFGVFAVSLNSVQKVTISNSGGATSFYELLDRCYNLGEFNLYRAPLLEDCYETFYKCWNLRNVNIGDLPSVYNVDYMFEDCYSLEHVELSGLSSADYFSNMFSGCKSLKSVKMSGLTSADSSLYDLVASYADGQFYTKSLVLEDLNSLTNVDNIFSGWGYLRGHVKLTGLINADLVNGFSNNPMLESVELHDLHNCTTADSLFYFCNSLKNVKLYGTQNIEDTYDMFAECYSLVNAPYFDTSSVTYAAETFYDCLSLQNVPLYNFSKVENVYYMFESCYSLQEIPSFDTSSIEIFYGMFDGCTSLKTIPLLDTSSSTGDFNSMFSFCTSLQSLPKLDVSSGTTFGSIFSSCTSLSSAPLQGASTDISFNNCCLSRSAILEIFKGLGITSGAEIDVSYNFGAADLTSEDISIAEGKGWTVLS